MKANESRLALVGVEAKLSFKFLFWMFRMSLNNTMKHTKLQAKLLHSDHLLDKERGEVFVVEVSDLFLEFG